MEEGATAQNISETAASEHKLEEHEHKPEEHENKPEEHEDKPVEHEELPKPADKHEEHEEHEEQPPLVAKVSTWKSNKDPHEDHVDVPSGETTVPETHVEKSAAQDGDLVRSVSSRHSRTSVVGKDRTGSRMSNASHMSATPSKTKRDSDVHQGTQPMTPSTNEPDSPSPRTLQPHSGRLDDYIQSNAPPPSARLQQPTFASQPQLNGSGKKKTFNCPGPVLGDKHGPCGHSVLCLSQYRNSPRHCFQPPYRDEARLNVPGPGQYAPASPAKAVPTDTSAILTSRPESWKENKWPSPRPGSYEVKSHILDGSKYSMGVPRYQPVRKVPGPGHYNPEEVPGKGDNYSLGRCKTGRTHAGGNANPGPGQYENSCYTSRLRSQSPQYSIKNATQREKDPRYDQRPGPTHYDKTTFMGSGKKVSHGMPRNGPNGHNFPGPGHYAGHLSTFHLS